MAIEKISLETFLNIRERNLILDVRSPGEYRQAHIPGAYSLPLFSDEERKIVGTAYKQQNRETAIKIGLDFFGPKMKLLVEQTEKLVQTEKEKTQLSKDVPNLQPATSKPATVFVHCWRGGMRSATLAWLLDLYGFKVYTLAGGYKAYRNWVLLQLEKDYHFHIIGGYTGSGKTLLLHELKNQARAIIDIEALANHKGSALGGLGKGTQPRQEMFENLLAENLFRHSNEEIFVEDESQRIGDLQIPMPLWYKLRKSAVYFFDIPFEERLTYLTEEYCKQGKEKLSEAVKRIEKRLGGLETKNAISFLEAENYRASFSILLKYYDKYYAKGLYNREDATAMISTVHSESIQPEINYAHLLKKLSEQKNKIATDQ